MWLVYLLLLPCTLCLRVRLDPLVMIGQGLVRGQLVADGDYSTFLGVPYARVDLDKPFGVALAPQEFNGIFDAYDGSIKCPQGSKNGADEQQNLDCLTLNIYSPNEATSDNLLPVLVYIHGGGFSRGSTAMFNPASLMSQGIIVVTINYRLGPYGFMCLDTPSVSGNQGIKDQLQALRWVQNNIAAFGGNPDQVTLGGESAGSACVLYHLYSNKEKLYNKIIVQSDTPQSEGMFIKQDVDAAIKLANYLGFNTTDSERAVEFLSSAAPNLVIAAAEELNLVFKPCEEKSFDDENSIVATKPTNLSNPKKVKGTPVLIGHTTREHTGVLFEMYGDDYLSRDPFYEKLQDHFDIEDSELINLAAVVRHFYIGDDPLTETSIAALENFDSDFVFNHPVQRTVSKLLQEEAGSVYQYLFSYTGDSGKDATGHADENKYLFNDDEGPRNENDKLMDDRMTTLWANFVKYGNPTPEDSDLLPVSWSPSTVETRPYLVIDKELRVESRVFHNRMAFWDMFYAQYGKFQV